LPSKRGTATAQRLIKMVTRIRESTGPSME
jgi:hypothetical protein